MGNSVLYGKSVYYVESYFAFGDFVCKNVFKNFFCRVGDDRAYSVAPADTDNYLIEF